MQAAVPLACFLSVIRPPGVQYESSLLQIAPVDKSKCPFVKDGNDVAFQLFTRHNPTVFQELKLDDDEKLFASNIDFHDKTVLYFHAWMETPEDGSAVMVREAYMLRGDTNVIMVDARTLEAGPWYFTAAQNTWYIGRFAGQFIDYLVTRGLNLNNTHLIGHSLGAQVAGVAGSTLQSGRVARITGLDAALPLFSNLPLAQRLDPTDAQFVDIIHTDAGIFGYKVPMGHVDFYPNGGISPQPGCELEVVIPKQLLLNKSTGAPTNTTQSQCFVRPDSRRRNATRGETTRAARVRSALRFIWDTELMKSDARTQTNGFYTYYLKGNEKTPLKLNSLEYKLVKLLAFIQSVKKGDKSKANLITLDKVKENIDSLYYFKDGIVDYLNGYDYKDDLPMKSDDDDLTKDLEYTEQTKNDENKNDKPISTTDEFTLEKKDGLTVEDVIDDMKLKTTMIVNDMKQNHDVMNTKKQTGGLEDKEITVEDVFEEFEQRKTKTDDEDTSIFIDQIAEETYYTAQTDVEEHTIPSYKIVDVKTRTKRTINGLNESGRFKELTVESGNLALAKDEKVTDTRVKNNERNEEDEKASNAKVCENGISKENSPVSTENDKFHESDSVTSTPTRLKSTLSSEEEFDIIEDEPNAFQEKEKEDRKPKFNLLRPRPILRQIIRLIPKMNKNRKSKRPFTLKFYKIGSILNPDRKAGSKINPLEIKGSKINPVKKLLKRQKRFLPFFQRSEDSNNILFRMLDFLIKNRKNVLPVFTVMREINTLVKSGNGELNHFSRESKNYIGATPSTFTPITYNLELGNENRVMAFVKKLFGVVPKGDRLTISSRK